MSLTDFRRYLSLAGLALALVAVTLDDERVTWFAIVVLVVAFGLRFVKRAPPPPPEQDPPPAE